MIVAAGKDSSWLCWLWFVGTRAVKSKSVSKLTFVGAKSPQLPESVISSGSVMRNRSDLDENRFKKSASRWD